MQQKINEEENILLELQKLEKQKKQQERLQKEFDFSILYTSRWYCTFLC